MNPDDPKLTAYALGELSDRERESIEQELAKSPEARAQVAQTQQIAEDLKRAFRAELDHNGQEPRNVLPLPYARLFWSERQWPGIAIAALLIASLAIAAMLVWRSSTGSGPNFASGSHSDADTSGTVTVEYSSDEERMPVDSASDSGGESPFVSVSAKPLSTFRLRVGTNSYPAVRKFIESGVRPPRDAVRIEEMINYFTYDYPAPTADRIVILAVDAASCPWATEHQLVRIAVKFREDASETIDEIISRSEVEVRFNPARVQSYRLLGYDAPVTGVPNAGPGDSIAQRQPQRSVTAFYEINLVNGEQPEAGRSAPYELLTARTKSLGSTSRIEAEEIFGGVPVAFGKASPDFRFAAAVAEFGMILRGSAYKGTGTLSDVIKWAETAPAKNNDSERTAFVECARKTISLL